MTSSMQSDERHSRHLLFAKIGPEGQQAIANARILLAGCGALGSRSAELLARAGAGTGIRGLIRIVDRDTVDVTNLQRQALFTTADAGEARPKARAAELHLEQIDPAVRVEAHVREITPDNVLGFFEEIDLVVDGTDNFATRFLLNDASIATKTPWIYGGAVGSHGIVAAFQPGRGACFRCLLGSLPALGVSETCDTSGIVTPLPAVVASIQSVIAMRFFTEGDLPRGIMQMDLWRDPVSWTHGFAESRPDPECRSCGTSELPALNDDSRELITLCGRNSVQILSSNPVSLPAIEKAMRPFASSVHSHPESVTARIPEGALTVFDDGRIIVEGTLDPHQATTLVARYLGG